MGYAVNSKGFRFYCPSHSPKIVESINAKFIEDAKPSAHPHLVELEEERELTEASSHIPFYFILFYFILRLQTCPIILFDFSPYF